MKVSNTALLRINSKKEKKSSLKSKAPRLLVSEFMTLNQQVESKESTKSTSMRICILWQLLPKFFLPRLPESLVRTKGCRVVAATAKALDSTENCWTSPNVARFAPWQTGSTNQVHGLLFDSQYQLFLACVKSYKAPTTSTAVRSLAPHDVFSKQFMKLSFLCDNLTSWLQPGDWKLESCKNATSNARCLLKFTDLPRFFFEAKKIRKIVVSRTWLSWLRRPARTRHNLCENFQLRFSNRYQSDINQNTELAAFVATLWQWQQSERTHLWC